VFLYHVTRKKYIESIMAYGLTPRKPIEWRWKIPPRWRNKEIIWLQGKSFPKSRRWSVRLKIDTSLLDTKNLHRLHKVNRESKLPYLDWWFYVGTIPPKAIEHYVK